MRIRELLTDDDAVSPVIGVILMVAITVILAAVIGAFVLGFGSGGPTAPASSWDTSEMTNDSEVTSVTFEATSTDTFNSSTLSVSPDMEAGSIDSDQVSAGSTVTIDFSEDTATDSLSAGEEISLVWSEGGSSSTIATHTLSAATNGSGTVEPSI